MKRIDRTLAKLTPFVITALICLSTSTLVARSIVDAYPGKTFSTLIDKNIFLKNGHQAYKAFDDDEIKVLKVTNLNRNGEGSLDWAVRQSGPRIIIFEVGGVIDMDGSYIKVGNPYAYIAGQTAPAPGVTLIKGGVQVNTHDVVVSHLSVRPGDRGLSVGSGWDADGIATYAAYNVLIENCSTTWSTDENLSASGPRHDGADKTSHCITFRNCLVAECLNESSHSKNEGHSKGSLIHDYCAGIAIVGNIYASNVERNPLLKPNAKAYISNNIIYNPQRRAIHSSWPEDEYKDYPGTMNKATAVVIGNILLAGPNTPTDFWLVFGKMDIYHNDNLILKSIDDTNGERSRRIVSKETTILAQNPMPDAKHTPIPSAQAIKNIIANVGARPAQRDDIDKRIIDGMALLKGQTINSQNEVDGYPLRMATKQILNVPSNGKEKWLAELSSALMN